LLIDITDDRDGDRPPVEGASICRFCHKPFARIDQQGLCWLISGNRLVDLSENTALIQTWTCARQTWHRKRASPAACWRGNWAMASLEGRGYDGSNGPARETRIAWGNPHGALTSQAPAGHLRCVTIEVTDREIAAFIRSGNLAHEKRNDPKAIAHAVHKLLDFVAEQERW